MSSPVWILECKHKQRPEDWHPYWMPLFCLDEAGVIEAKQKIERVNKSFDYRVAKYERVKP